ncbi:hypothetical protein Clacol_007595 [Clathrus columnatus]|uniref:AMP-dependent synthetase/ligase domain-containing protein n=1 Tax=Clathrus columnatus TaxID=1419009 RepID=A0AAV5AJQ9_9AGAM|nr:hypothetical protein Clacol_007595 [Clathrus columnatus]
MAVDVLSYKADIVSSFLLKPNSAINDSNVNTLPAIPSFSHGPTELVPYSCIHHAFAYHAQRAPQSIAAITHGGEGDRINYGELYVLSSRIAHKLQEFGVKRGDRVILLTQRSIPLLVGIFAVLKAGAAYVPLDGGIVTDSSLTHVASDSGANIVMVGQEWHQRVDKLNECLSNNGHRTVRKVILEEIVNQMNFGLEDAAIQREIANDEFKTSGTGTDGCYVIYTSGTTGKPKGVDVMHYNVTNLVCLEPGNVGMQPGLRVAQLLNIAFDMAAWEILGCFSNGCTLILRGKTSKEWKIALKNVDIVIATPTILGSHEPDDYPNIKFAATAGEVCPQSLADKWSKYALFHNSCGPTEITIVNTVEAHIYGEPLSIGKPTPNNSVYILDPDTMRPVGIGEQGIMWAGGNGITRGYIGLDELTKKKYKPDPWRPGGVMFNTGDIGRWRPDGMLEHLGRADDQVKVKGFRVELDGVAAAMETCYEVKVAVSLLIGTELWGFLTPSDVDVEKVKASASQIQPYYAVPTKYITMQEFPHTSNGKIDKRALRAMAEKQIGEKSLEKSPLSPKPPSEVIIIETTPIKTPDYTFTPYKIPPHIYNKVSNWMATDAEHPSPLWTSLIQEPAIPPKAYQPNFVPYRPQQLSPVSSELGDSDCYSGDSSRLSKAPSFDSHETKVEEISTTTPQNIEKGEADVSVSWEGYLDAELPDQKLGNTLSRLRHSIFTLYRRLFGFVFVTNVIIFIITVIRGPMTSLHLGEIVIANFFVAILMRQDYVVNAFFNFFCAVPPSWPLSIRRVCARVYHIGGLHSGAAISAIVWLILFSVQATIELVQNKVSIPTLVVTYLILLLLLLIVLFAYPRFRTIAHNRFERSHRFMGWTATALSPTETLGHALKTSVPFWLVVIMTGSIILPWLRLRRVPVRSVVLSPHAVRLYFNYTTPIAGSYTRISRSPLLEWHSFATVPEPGKTGYSLVVSKAGDWTTQQIEDPPTHLWVRGIPTFGVLRIVPLFNRLVFVATGSGIGPCAPCILEQRVPIRLLWTSPDVRKTFGDHLVDSILEKSPGAVIYDTRKYGKPDMVKLTMKLVREFNAEAVCVISNQKLTEQVVYGMMSRGIPAFGAIWDS